MRRSAARSYRYSGVDSPRGTPGGAASNSASYLSRCQTCSRYVSTSPGPPFDGGGPSARKNFGSLIGDMYRPGCRDSAACSAVVPALGTPATRKSGSAMFPLVLTPRVRAGGQIDNISDDINRDSPGRSNPYPAARPARIPHRPDPVRAALMACADSASNGRSGSSPARRPRRSGTPRSRHAHGQPYAHAWSSAPASLPTGHSSCAIAVAFSLGSIACTCASRPGTALNSRASSAAGPAQSPAQSPLALSPLALSPTCAAGDDGAEPAEGAVDGFGQVHRDADEGVVRVLAAGAQLQGGARVPAVRVQPLRPQQPGDLVLDVVGILVAELVVVHDRLLNRSNVRSNRTMRV